VLGLGGVLAAAPSALAWTWPADGPVLREFSVGSNPYAGGQHRGIDVALAGARVVRAPAGGTVSYAGQLPSHGLTVTIATGDGHKATLTHLGPLLVRRGQHVAEGAPVAEAGPSGDPEHDTPYVHLGVRVGDGETYVDPLTLLPPLGAPIPPPAPPAPPAPAPAPPAAAPAPPPPTETSPPDSTPAPEPAPAPSPAPAPATSPDQPGVPAPAVGAEGADAATPPTVVRKQRPTAPVPHRRPAREPRAGSRISAEPPPLRSGAGSAPVAGVALQAALAEAATRVETKPGEGAARPGGRDLAGLARDAARSPTPSAAPTASGPA